MPSYWDIFLNGYTGYAGYFWDQVTNPGWRSYFYWLIVVSAFFFALEIFMPWRKNQKKFRKDFWLDFFYMFFNFFLFWLIIYNAASDVVVNFLNDGIKSIFQFDLQASNPMNSWPLWAILITGFIVRDFIQWWTHRLLHRVDFLWNFHKVHHSVEEMGFAAHLRYHWMETLVYRAIEYLPLALLGIGLYDFFIIYLFTLVVGHYNHSNISVDSRWTGSLLGMAIGFVISMGYFDIDVIANPGLVSVAMGILVGGIFGFLLLAPVMKKFFNSPEMHIWHHAMNIPEERKYGLNFGITLAIWDYIFKTAYIPDSGRDIRLGFPGLEKFPQNFVSQVSYGIFPGRSS
jgi:sterol desaturase/sphingolipid hydroxylase (fatty acid hydroxylase superfamily)